MSHSDWDIPENYITQIANEQNHYLETDMRQFWSQFGMTYCENSIEKADILIMFFKKSTKVIQLRA